MKFSKDILILDFEGRDLPAQVGAVLLDRETLEEKDSFISFIQADLHGEALLKSGITEEMLVDAPSQAIVGQQLYDRFGSDVFLASFVQNKDIRFFQTLLQAASIDFVSGPTDFQKYDFHILDIWPLAYTHLLKEGYAGSTKSEDIFQAFGATPRGLHNALEDCRITADVLRKIVFAD
jgi:DNA polymerase III epsilon subunit-like protein